MRYKKYRTLYISCQSLTTIMEGTVKYMKNLVSEEVDEVNI